jgi:acylglycerol lipase
MGAGVIMSDKNRTRWLQTTDGIHLYVEKNEAADARAAVLILHGLAEHLGRYNYTAGKLTESGLSVYRFDLRGHGRSEGKRGYVDHLDVYLSDTGLALNWLKGDYPTLPTFVLGHSMGGLIATAYHIKHRDHLTGQIFTGAAVIHLPLFDELRRTDFNLTPDQCMPNSLANLISHDQIFIQSYLDDPLVLPGITYKLLGEIFIRGIEWLSGQIHYFNAPCLILHGADDQIVTPKSAEYLYEHISSADKTLKIYDHLYHDILNEFDKDLIIEEICEWIKERL